MLAGIHLDHVKDEVIDHAKDVCDHLLRTSNVRTIWRVGRFSEALLAHLPANVVTALTIRGEPPAASPRLLGRCNPAGPGPDPATTFNDTIDVFPGGFDNPPDGGGIVRSEVDTETQALIIELENRTFPDPDLEQFAIAVYGRLIGENMAHEIVHCLIGFDIPTGHNSPPIPNDLMNRGGIRHFTQRTGIEDTAHMSPVDPNNFLDHGIGVIGGLQAANQARMDARFPGTNFT